MIEGPRLPASADTTSKQRRQGGPSWPFTFAAATVACARVREFQVKVLGALVRMVMSKGIRGTGVCLNARVDRDEIRAPFPSIMFIASISPGQRAQRHCSETVMKSIKTDKGVGKLPE